MIKYWRVTFEKDGRVRAVRPIKPPKHDRWVVVQAATEQEAGIKAYRLYTAGKKRAARERLKAEGRCRCGRQKDSDVRRGVRAGKEAAYCSVCLERSAVYHQRSKQTPERTHAEAMAARNEPARLEVQRTFQRDRRSELRLETLLEVRSQWRANSTVGAFSAWLEQAIKQCTDPQKAA